MQQKSKLALHINLCYDKLLYILTEGNILPLTFRDATNVETV